MQVHQIMFHTLISALKPMLQRLDGLLSRLVLKIREPYRRPVSVSASTVFALLLHGLVLLWFTTQAAPLAFSAAAPLPMIAMELSAPPSPVNHQPIAPTRL